MSETGQNPGMDDVRELEASGSEEEVLQQLERSQDALIHLAYLAELAEKKGVLKNLEYFLAEVDELFDQAVEQATSPSALAAMAKLKKYAAVVNSLDESALQRMAQLAGAVVGGMNAPSRSTQVNGFWDIIKLTRDPEIQRAIGAIFSGLKKLGGELSKES